MQGVAKRHCAINPQRVNRTKSDLLLLNQELDKISKTSSRVSTSGQQVGVTDISDPVIGIDENAIDDLTCPSIQRIQGLEKAVTQPDIESTADLLVALANEISIF